MLINFYRAKKAELKVKAKVYGAIAKVIDEHEEILATASKIFNSLKNSTAEDIRSEFIGAIAKLIHEGNKSDNGVEPIEN